MKTSELIRELQEILKQEGDLSVCIHAPDSGSYACVIDYVRAGADGTCEDDDFGATIPGSFMARGRVAVIFGGY